jgi:hypothetical protein
MNWTGFYAFVLPIVTISATIGLCVDYLVENKWGEDE